MKERVKVFTYVSSAGATVIESALEEHVNQFLDSVKGRLVNVTQSESERNGTAHVTVCVWYVPGKAD